MDEELKPCPCCDGPAVHRLEAVYFVSKDMEFWHTFACEWCGFRTAAFEDIEMAAKAWNTRVERTCTMNEAKTPGFFKCSNCGQVGINSVQFKYCPNCGAKVLS